MARDGNKHQKAIIRPINPHMEIFMKDRSGVVGGGGGGRGAKRRKGRNLTCRYLEAIARIRERVLLTLQR